MEEVKEEEEEEECETMYECLNEQKKENQTEEAQGKKPVHTYNTKTTHSPKHFLSCLSASFPFFVCVSCLRALFHLTYISSLSLSLPPPFLSLPLLKPPPQPTPLAGPANSPPPLFPLPQPHVQPPPPSSPRYSWLCPQRASRPPPASS